MAVVARRLTDRYVSSYSPSRRGVGSRMATVALCARRAAPCACAAVALALPFGVYTTGLSRVAAASNRRVGLKERIAMRRVEISALNRKLQELRDPSEVAKWARLHAMTPATDVFIVRRHVVADRR